MDEWRASLTEYRIAGITAFIGIALILLVSSWPELFTIKQEQAKPEISQKANVSNGAEQVRKVLPAKPSAPATATQNVEEPPVEQAPPAVIDAKKTPVAPEKQASTPPPKPVEKPVAPTGGYYVQAGAFKDAAGARAVVAKLSQHGWPAIVVPKGGLFAVWAGPRQSRDAIEKLQQEIQRGLNIKGFIVQKKPS